MEGNWRQSCGDTLKTEKGEIVYFRISPSNLAVLSPENTESKIRGLMLILSSVAGLEFCCFDSAESSDANKQYLKQRIKNEDVSQIRELLQKELLNLDEMQIKTSTVREFVFVIRFKKGQCKVKMKNQ